MGKPRRTFPRQLKVEAVKRVTEQGHRFAEAAANLGIAESLLRQGKQNLDAENNQTFPGSGRARQCLRVHRGVLQPRAATLGLGLPVAGRV